MSKETMGYLRKCTPVLSILSDNNRQDILMLLFDYGEMTVSEVTEQINLSRPAVSHHLKVLLDKDIVKVRKSGKERYYSLSLEDSIALLKKLLDSLEHDMATINREE